MSIERKINSTGLLNFTLVLAVLSQILIPIYSDRNFLALGQGGLIQKACFATPESHLTDECNSMMANSNFYDSFIFIVHYYFGDLGLVIAQICVSLFLSLFLMKVVLPRESKYSSFQFFLYLISLVAIFYGRDISPDHFFVLGFLSLVILLRIINPKNPLPQKEVWGPMRLLVLISIPYLLIALLSIDTRFYLLPLLLSLFLGLYSGIKKTVWLGLTAFQAVLVLWSFSGSISNPFLRIVSSVASEIEGVQKFGFLSKPVGEEIFHAVYSLAISSLLLLMATLTFRKDLKQIIKISVLLAFFAISLFVPLFRMICAIFCLMLLCSDIESSRGLTNISNIFIRFMESLNYLSGYALIFFLAAFIFTQADGAFKYPLTTLFMPVERVDKLLESNQCIGESSGFTETDFHKYSGYLKYREVYSGLKPCSVQ